VSTTTHRTHRTRHTHAHRPPRRVVVLADLNGDDAHHVGDEAMTEATVAWLRSLAPGGDLEVTVSSSDPEATARRLGCAAAPWVGFAGCSDDADRHALALRAAAHPGDHRLLDAVANADALVVAGGGNLNSMWPEHVYERVVAARVARRVGIPVVVTGQTIGPFDTGPERTLVAELLGEAALVGVREPHSAAEIAALGVDPLRRIEAPDDAVLLEPAAPPTLPATFDPGTPEVPTRTIAVTVHPFAPPGDPRYEALGHQLATLATRLSAQVLCVPHVRTAEHPDGVGDRDVAAILAEVTGGAVLEAPSAREAVWASRTAWLVVSSRYHPIVFATAARVPALALTHGHYTAVKCRGALSQVGCDEWWVDLEAAADGLLLDAAGELARRREEVADWMAEHLAAVRTRDEWRRWRLAAALGFPVGAEPVIAAAPPARAVDTPRPAGGWADQRA